MGNTWKQVVLKPIDSFKIVVKMQQHCARENKIKL